MKYRARQERLALRLRRRGQDHRLINRAWQLQMMISREEVMCRGCGWTNGMVCPECPSGCGCDDTGCTGWRHWDYGGQDDPDSWSDTYGPGYGYDDFEDYDDDREWEREYA